MFDAPDCICFHLDQSHQLVSWNSSFETVTGCGGSEPGQLRLSDVIEAQDLTYLETAAARAQTVGRAETGCNLIGRSGTSIPCTLEVTSLRTRSEPLLCVQATRQASTTSPSVLSSSEELFRRIYNHSNDGIFVYDPGDDVIVEANPRACRMLEYDREDLLSMSITDIVPGGLPPAIDGLGEMLCETGSGSRFPAEISVSSIQLAGETCLLAIVRDIRERKRVKRAEEDLERLASFPELNRHPIVELTADGLITYHNPAAAQAFPEIDDTTDVCTADVSSPLVDCLCSTIETLDAQGTDRLICELETDASVYEVHISRIRPHQLIRVYLYDVTERKLAEAEVAELKSFYQNVLGDLPTELAVFDHEGRYMYLNRAAVSDDTVRRWLIGRTSVDYANYRGRDPEPYQKRHEWIQETIRRKETRERIEVITDDNGEDRHKLRMITPVLDEAGKVKYALGYGLDLTERKKATEALRREKEFTEEIINALDDVFFAYDLNGRLLRWNNHVTRLTGYTEEDVRSMQPADFLAEGERYTLYRQLVKGGSSGEIAFETRLQAKSGEILPFEVIGSYLHWNNRTIVAGIGRDISERKKRERALIEAKERAEEMNQLKSAFLANMSHEIRTPLTAILGFADVLEEEMLPAKNEFVHLIQKSGKRLLHTLDSVLDLAQLEAGSKTIEPRAVDLVQQITEPVEMLRPQARQKGLSLQLETPDEPVIASVDPAGLVRILTNLISNGIKFTSDGRVVVRVRPNGTRVHIDVSDTGRGIDRSFQSDLFKAFKQESSGLDRSHHGTGLGLTIVKQLTELMNGDISVRSTKGKGSTFTVSLPMEGTRSNV